VASTNFARTEISRSEKVDMNWPKKKIQLGGLLVWLVVLWLPAGVVQAQMDTFEQVRDFLDRTQEILMHAQEVVADSESARARHILQEAEHLQRQAESLWNKGQPRQAHQVSSRSRRAAQLSVRVARDEQGFEERTRARLERLRDLHDQVLDRTLEVNDQRALRFVREAERQFQRAREQYGQHNYEMAFNLLKTAEMSLQRATRLLFESGGPAQLEQEMERTRDLLANTREKLGPDPDPLAIELLSRAFGNVEQAQESLVVGEPFRAVYLLRQARRLAGRAITVSGGGPAAETVQTQIERWDVRYSEVSEFVQEAGSEEAGLLLERARRFRQRAGELLADDDHVGGLRQIKIAHDLLNEASELVR
jgi:hypothetical protein